MKHYRIEVTTLNDGTQRFQPQVTEPKWYAGLGTVMVWSDLNPCCSNEPDALDVIKFSKLKEPKSVEYIELEPKMQMKPPLEDEGEPILQQRSLGSLNFHDQLVKYPTIYFILWMVIVFCALLLMAKFS